MIILWRRVYISTDFVGFYQDSFFVLPQSGFSFLYIYMSRLHLDE
jgi:hypothetical protein